MGVEDEDEPETERLVPRMNGLSSTKGADEFMASDISSRRGASAGSICDHRQMHRRDAPFMGMYRLISGEDDEHEGSGDSAGVPPPSASLPVAPIQPEAGPSSAGSSSAGSSTGANVYRGNVVQES